MGRVCFRVFILLVSCFLSATQAQSPSTQCASEPPEPAGETGGCRQQIVINPLSPSCGGGGGGGGGGTSYETASSCNCSAVRGLILTELEEPKRQLQELQSSLDRQQAGGVSPGQEEGTQAKLQQLLELTQSALIDRQQSSNSNVSSGQTGSSGIESKLQQLLELTQSALIDRQQSSNSNVSSGQTGSSGIESKLQQLEVKIYDLTTAINRCLEQQGLEPQAMTYPKDCSEAQARGAVHSGAYKIQPKASPSDFEVHCDMETDGGGWTDFQRRYDGSCDFYRNFANYSEGFGEITGEFWLGNNKLYQIISQGDYELRVDLTDPAGNGAYAIYGTFSITDASDNFRLNVESYRGTAGDALYAHNGEAFTTKDMDNDQASGNCAQEFNGAWWYRGCYVAGANLNTRFSDMEWLLWAPVNIRSSRMAVRLKSIRS